MTEPAGGPLFGRAVVVLAAIRVAIPVVTLAFTGHDLPLLPPYDYDGLSGDAEGFYSAMRALMAAAADVHPVAALLELVVIAAAWIVARRCWQSPRTRWVALVVSAAAVSIGLTLVVLQLPGATGAAVVGWSLVLAVPLLPFRVLGLGPGTDLTFAVGFTLSLACVAITTFATAALGSRVTGRREVGVVAAGVWALWPLLAAPLAGHSAWENSQWNVDVGLHLYTEPLSTALVTTALALVAVRAPSLTASCASGLLLGFATVVKLSNALLVAVAAAVLLASALGRRAAGVAVVASLVWTPLLFAYWPKGYVGMFGGQIAAEERPFAPANIGPGWADSLLFTPRLLTVLVPLVLAGLLLASRRGQALLGGSIVVTAAFYSLYEPFAQHPRFLYAVLPSAFVLVAVALVRAWDGLGTRRRRRGQRTSLGAA